MMLLQASRAFRFAAQNIRRNLWLSIVTTIIVAVAVFSVSLVSALNIIGQRALDSVEERVDVTLELVRGTTDDQAQELAQDVRERTDVKNVTYTSSAQALENFRKAHADEPNVQQLLDELTENPLPASITIVAKDVDFYDAILAFVNQDDRAKLIADSQRDFQDSKIVIERLTSITNRIRDVGLGVSSVFALLSLIVVLNTIRIAIYTHREEIGIMRLVGASNGFIRAPFILESIIYSAAGAGLAILLMAFLWQSAAPALQKFFFEETAVGVSGLLSQYFWSIVGWQFVGALVLSTLSAGIATRRYLKV